jgi:putative ABC transport system permease protein
MNFNASVWLNAASIALEAIGANKLRAVLTALGIIFGVGAVIAMLAIGNGAQKEILEQLKTTGVNNIVITPILPKAGETEDISEKGEKQQKKFSPGLSLDDAKNIIASVPKVRFVSPEIQEEIVAVAAGKMQKVKLVGIDTYYPKINNRALTAGSQFSNLQIEYGKSVCILSPDLATKFFPGVNPIGKPIKIGKNWLTVTGVYATLGGKTSSSIQAVIPEVYIPIKTMLLRYVNRSLVNEQKIKESQNNNNNDDGEAPKNKPVVNYHQLDKLIVQIAEGENLESAAQLINRILQRRHNQVPDYEVSVPELLLKQQQRTKNIFTIVLGAIAGISLAVGGIGIMNIMLASVLERIKEIGLRKSLGATNADIVLQFLFESVLISLVGGVLGVILGVGLAYTISKVAEIPIILTAGPIVLSFGVAAGTGLLFGIAPARKAAHQDPITSLRYE